jgi:2-polyprenyl-3-methyl-5-hydroxy-6-metoxy-1,4-benzoquinol methylase
MTSEVIKETTVGYYNMLKKEFLPLIPEGPNVILDLGCGVGRLGRVLREMNKAAIVIGVDCNASATEEATKHYDKVYQGDIELMNLPFIEHFDFILCGDILEHLKNPWSALINIKGMLKPDGTLICSIPNVRYYKVIIDLLFHGTWEYTDAGILDSTHLRFFTKSSFIQMLRNANYRVTWLYMSIHGKKRIANKMTFSIFSEFLATQMMIAARKN